MEDYFILVSIMMIGMFALMGAKMFKPNDGHKRAKKQVTEDAQKEVISSKDLTITTLKNELRSINGKLARFRQLEPEYEDEEPEGVKNPVSWDQISALAKQQYPQYATMLPLFKKQIMEATEGMTMEEILDYVKKLTGNKGSQEGISPQSAQYNPNWA